MIMEWHADCEIFYSTDGRPVHDVITTSAALSNLILKKVPLRKSFIYNDY